MTVRSRAGLDRSVAETAQVPVFASALVANELLFTHTPRLFDMWGDPMPAFRLRKSLMAVVSGLALAVLIQPGAGFAYTQEEEQACTPDAMRLCGEFVPNVDAITACMVQKKAQLSPQCRPFFRQGPEPSDATVMRAGQPTSIKPKTASKAAKKSTKPKATKKKKPEDT